jgi:hypothetical protein
MDEIVKKALSAKRESKCIEFKAAFDPNSAQDWCEIIKDIIAITNSGSGVLIFGLNSNGSPSNFELAPLSKLDPATITDKIYRYTGYNFSEFEIFECDKNGAKLVAVRIFPVSIPVVFENPGTYSIGNDQQRTAFAKGTIYFRHGAKSEPGCSDDLRRFVERQVESVRRSLLKGVRKVVQAPLGSHVTIVAAKDLKIKNESATPIRIVDDLNAPAFRMTQDPNAETKYLPHENLSDGLFDEINNVLRANTLLTTGRKGFLLGEPIYYRIYAERQHVRKKSSEIELLANAGLNQFYAPMIYWLTCLPYEKAADLIRKMCNEPKSPCIYHVLRIAILLGSEVCEWIKALWTKRWGKHSQAPAYFHTFLGMCKAAQKEDSLFVALKIPRILSDYIGQDDVEFDEALQSSEVCEQLLSKACMDVFGGESQLRGICRDLDVLAHGREIIAKSTQIGRPLIAESISIK